MYLDFGGIITSMASAVNFRDTIRSMKTTESKPSSRTYRKRARAQQEDETRQRIVDAAIELHQTTGIMGSSIAAIAERAGVGRVTVYRHFPDYDAIIHACTTHYMGINPPPQVTDWEALVDPEVLLPTVVADVYDYFQANEPMFTQGATNSIYIPYLAERMVEIGMYWTGIRDWLITRLLNERMPTQDQAALVGLLLSFTGWQALVRQQQLSFDAAKHAAIVMIANLLDVPPAP
jgi:AcrR family transcriptional regulator